MNKFFKLLLSVLIPLLVGLVGCLLALGSVDWCSTIHKPPFNPPNWIFVSIWTILYIFVGLSFYYVWDKKDLKEFKSPVLIYLIQLGLSLLWFILFFGLKNPDLAFVEMFFLLISIAIFSLKFYRINKKLGCLLIPYILWISFVAILNFSIVILN